VGGTSIMGGKGKLIGTAIGVVMVCIINRAIIFLGFQDYYGTAVQGVIILIAVLFTVTDIKRLKYHLLKILPYNHSRSRKENR